MLAILLTLLKETMFFASFVKSNAFPEPLGKDDEAKYIELMAKGDENARHKLIEHNLRLVAHIAKKYENKKDLNEDIISIGTVGLIKGVDSFSADKGAKLATYAAKCIENEILMHLRSNKKTNADVSLNDVIGQDKDGSEISLIDIIPAENEEMIETIHLSDNIKNLLNYINILEPREKEIIIMRYGLFNNDEYTQKDIAKMYKISRSYVSRIEKRALMKLLREFVKNNNN